MGLESTSNWGATNEVLLKENKQLQTKLDIAVGAIKEMIDGNGDRCKDCKINVQTGIEALQQIKGEINE